MEFGGRYRFGTGRDQVWHALNDADVLKQTIPGCARIGWTSDTTLEAAIAVNLGLARPVFVGDLELSNIVPAQTYTLSGRGRGGLLGLAHGAADISLSDAGVDCVLAFRATGGASGTIMKLGRAIVGASAQKVIDRFFERFADAMQVEMTVLPPEAAALSLRLDPE